MQQAILVVSFGSSYEDTLKRTIQKIEEDIKGAFPAWKVYRAFTSKRIIERLSHKGINIDNVESALNRMKADGVKRIVVQPTFIIKGIEYNKMYEEVEKCKGEFEQVGIGAPLLSSVEDYFKTVRAFTRGLGPIEQDEAIVGMGHGAEHFMSVSYAALDYMFKDSQHKNIYIATIGSYPRIENVIRQLKECNYKKVRLVPFMIVAGYHVQKSLVEKVEESWEHQLSEEGFEVKMQLEGLGENKAIREIYVEHAGALAKEK